MEEEYVVIPRNIKVKEIVAYGLNGKQILYIALSVGGSLFLWSLGIPVDAKMAGSVMCIAGSLALALARAHGQELDRYIWNSIKYPLRQKEYGGEGDAKTQGTIVRIGCHNG